MCELLRSVKHYNSVFRFLKTEKKVTYQPNVSPHPPSFTLCIPSGFESYLQIKVELKRKETEHTS